jgi:hypothetical protein
MVLSLGSLKNYEIAGKEYPSLESMLKEAVPLAIFGGLASVEGKWFSDLKSVKRHPSLSQNKTEGVSTLHRMHTRGYV